MLVVRALGHSQHVPVEGSKMVGHAYRNRVSGGWYSDDSYELVSMLGAAQSPPAVVFLVPIEIAAAVLGLLMTRTTAFGYRFGAVIPAPPRTAAVGVGLLMNRYNANWFTMFGAAHSPPAMFSWCLSNWRQRWLVF